MHNSNGAAIAYDDDWKLQQQAEIEQTGIAPKNDLEAETVLVLAAGSYTAIVEDARGGTGVALVEVYNLQ